MKARIITIDGSDKHEDMLVDVIFYEILMVECKHKLENNNCNDSIEDKSFIEKSVKCVNRFLSNESDIDSSFVIRNPTDILEISRVCEYLLGYRIGLQKRIVEEKKIHVIGR